ncbi:MAG: S9 family peptidase [Sphingomonas sp.]|jgi:dipeptidyl aminopeptidase/acylaminoacyl peptidase
MAAAGLIAAAPDAMPTQHRAAETAKAFGVRQQVQQISLSPDGTRFAVLLSVKARAQVLAIASIDNPANLKAILNADSDPEHIETCGWANNSQVICSVRSAVGKVSNILSYSRQLIINADGSGIKLLSSRDSRTALNNIQFAGNIVDWYGDAGGTSILMTRAFAEEESTGTLLSNSRDGLGVERVDPTTLKRTTVELPNKAAQSYITDGSGNVRITARRGSDSNGYANSKTSYLYRRPGSRNWEPLFATANDGKISQNFAPIAVDPTLNVAYGFDDQNGHDALFKVALDGTNKLELVYANPDVDVDELIRIGRKRRVVGVSYATDRRKTVFFDPDLNKLTISLVKAVPQLPLISFVDSSADESKLLLWGGSDTQPGIFLVFDKKTKHLDKLLDVRPELNDYSLAAVKSITYTASDGTQVPAYLTLPPGSDGKNLPAIVMPHGGPGARDEWGFDPLVQFFAARGFAVLQPNYRGSTGYGDQWFGANGFKAWRTAVGDVDDAGRWLVKQGIAAPDHLAIVGWSYGGYAALQSQVVDPDLFKAVVAIAPVTDLDSWREEFRNYTNFKVMDNIIGTGAHIEAGSPARHAGAFKVPVLMFHGDRDENVSVAESRLMASRLRSLGKSVELVEFKGLDHYLDDNDALPELLLKSDTFLRSVMKLPE